MKHVVIDGKSNFFLDQYPEQAWTELTPSATDTADSREALDAIGKYYETVGFLHRCVAIRADAMLRVPWAVMRGETDVWTNEMPEPPESMRYLKDFRRLLRLTEMALCLSPEAFWFRERNRARTLSFKWHAPSSVIPQWSATEGLTGFKRMLGNGNTRMFEVDDYVYFALPNPLHETIPGRPPAQAAMAAAGVLYNVDAFASSFFKRGAIKATLLTIEGNPPPGELLKLESWWKRAFAGVAQAWQTAAVRAGVTPVIIGEGIESLAKSDLTREHKEDIATALGIPHSLVMSDAANRSVAETDDLHFYDKTVIPAFEMIVETLNEQVFYPTGHRMELRPQRMSIYQEDEEQRSMSVLHYTQASVPVEIAMQMLGVDLPAGMDYETFGAMMAELRAQQSAAAQMIAQAQSMATPPAEADEPDDDDEDEDDDEEEEEDDSAQRAARMAEIKRLKLWAKKRKYPNADDFVSDLLTPDEKRAVVAEVSADADFFTDIPLVKIPSIWSGRSIPDAADSIAAWKQVLTIGEDDDDDAEQRARDAIERIAADNIAEALERQRRALVPANSPPANAEDVVNRVEETSGTVRDALRRMLIESVDLGVSVAIAQFDTIGFGFDWTLANTAARDWANAYSYELIRGINGTTRQQIRQAVSEWIENGDPLSVLVRELAPTFGRQRASLIASTEVTRAYAEANRRAYIESGVVSQMQWRTSNDERVCPICAPLGGLVFNTGGASPVSTDQQDGQGVRASLTGSFVHPGGGGAANRFLGQSFSPPPAHPRCRCWIVPVIEEPEAYVPRQQAQTVTVPTFEKVKDAEAWARQNKAKFANYRGFSPEAANAMNRALSYVPDDIDLDLVGDYAYYKKITNRTFTPNQNKATYGVSSSDASRIFSIDSRVRQELGMTLEEARKPMHIVGINTGNYKTPASIAERKKVIQAAYENQTGRQYFFNMDGDATFHHEVGHIVYNARTPGDWSQVAQQWRITTTADNIKDDSEAFAEAWAAYHIEQKDRLPSAVIEFVERMKRGQ